MSFARLFRHLLGPLYTPAIAPTDTPGAARSSLSILSALAIALALVLPGQAWAEKGMPKPHVSPALGAVLLPITPAVRQEFKLGKKAAGAVVVSVDPGGVGELYGLEPGDVISQLNDKFIRRPVDIDTMVKYQLGRNENYFFLDGTRNGRKKKTILFIDSNDYARPVDLDNISRWRAYNSGGASNRGKRGRGLKGSDGYFITGGNGFYYADFCDGYNSDFYEVYDYTLIYVEEIIVTEVYITAYDSTDAVFYYDDAVAGYDYVYDDYYAAEVDEYVYSEEFIAEYSSTETVYEDQVASEEFVDDGSVADDGSAEGTDATGDGQAPDDQYTDAPTDEGQVTDEQVADEPLADEPMADEPVADEQVYEEPAAEEPVADEQVYEEPPAEEPPAEEPAYEEPAYEEPPAEDNSGGGGDCGVDEDGNPLC